MKKKLAWKPAALGLVILAIVLFTVSQVYVYAPDVGQLGGPIEGLTPKQLRKFYQAKEVFKQEFTPEEGLGPLFNGKSCFECHGQPGVPGGEGRDIAGTGVQRIARLQKGSPLSEKPRDEIIDKLKRTDVSLMLFDGGPAIQRKSITNEFPDKYPKDCSQEIETTTKLADFISMRHAGPIFGFGLIENIPDPVIIGNSFKQIGTKIKAPGRSSPHLDRMTESSRAGRFGWKAQQGNLVNFTTEAMNQEMGITTFTNVAEMSDTGINRVPGCLRPYLPEVPNDKGKITASLVYYQTLLAPPGRGEITEQVKKGEKLFEKLGCAICHMPETGTNPTVYVVDPDSPFPKFNYIQVEALQNKPVRAYSDFLLHSMGKELADGVPQAGAASGEWRTTPLWGLRFKKFLMHDGRTTSLVKAIQLHGGDAQPVTDEFEKLPKQEKEDLLAFLRSL